jgi:hypothetical protein
MRRFRRPSGRTVLLTSVVVVLVLAVGLFVQAYRKAGSGQDATAAGGLGAGQSMTQPAIALTATPGPGAVKSPAELVAVGGRPAFTFTAAGGPGFTIVPAPRHRLVATVHSSIRIGTVGFLIPTSPDHSYGSAKNVGTSWSLRTTVTGKPYYAAIFVQAGATGAPITCTIMLDGKIISSKQTHGEYGRQVCYG